MHILARIVVPPQAVWPDDGSPIDIDAQSQTELEVRADEAHAVARSYVGEQISIHREYGGGFSDWHNDGAGRWTESLLEEYTDVNGAGREEQIVLVGEDAREQLEMAHEETKDALENKQQRIADELEAHGLEMEDLLTIDPTELRKPGDFGMLRHYLNGLTEYAPQPEVRAYIASPVYKAIETESQYEQALEDIDDGGFVVPIDVHY